jgi:hypothetical protein
MNEVMELRCLLEEGQIIKHIMTIAVTLMIVEARSMHHRNSKIFE